ncbi:high affinity nitrate transporter 2.4-like [Hibiscus syriacus]|uniref:High affinity nitrate transporter 2.4-like n=1 Tax=Hibiscus syriacus TaxID=106335 RepID=A0A6A2WNF9_HIBSY|nr:high affinity nitrate transporter 2.4-like [Hibiscus syriacus]
MKSTGSRVVALSENVNLYGSAAACGDSWPKLQSALDYRASSLINVKSQQHTQIIHTFSGIAGNNCFSSNCCSSVGGAATFLVRRTKASDATEVPWRPCEDCVGSGICSECKGEGFVLKKMSEGSAERARLTAKNMATRYTVGLPKKWRLHKMFFHSIMYCVWRQWKIKLAY